MVDENTDRHRSPEIPNRNIIIYIIMYNMKKILNLCLMAALTVGLGLSVTSCKDDDDDNNKSEEQKEQEQQQL